jgi:N-acetylglucosaminyldiphosphoundecaprenol N-acetyl-beta-D-mannosaminyltransferase
MKLVEILGTKVNSFFKDDFLFSLSEGLERKSKIFIVTANPEGVLLAKINKKFQKAINSANHIVADGWGLIWASYFLNKRFSKNFLKFFIIPIWAIFSLIIFSFYKKPFRKIIPERIAGSDIFWDILKIANKKDKTVFLLGGFDGVARKTAKKIKNKFPQLRIIGISEANPQDKNIVKEINKLKVDILFIAWGQPKQELWIYNNLDKLDVKLAIGVGGTFDFVAGTKKRAPKAFRKAGFEWLWRLFIEPKRIFRIFAAVPKFMYAICIEKIKNPERQSVNNGNKN